MEGLPFSVESNLAVAVRGGGSFFAPGTGRPRRSFFSGGGGVVVLLLNLSLRRLKHVIV